VNSIDLNCDLGEGAGADAEIMPFITSANIACGAHAGDAATMRAAVGQAMRNGVTIGAHPGFDDRAHFGRRELPIDEEASAELVFWQIRALQAVAQSLSAAVVHVKPHGGLYNLAARDRRVADGIAMGVWRADPGLMLVGLAGGELLAAGRARGLRVASEGFADRAYRADGSLLPRGQPGAVLHDPAAAVAQGLRMARESRVRTVDGAEIPVQADTICLHGDGACAADFARRLREALTAAGVHVQAAHLPPVR
jgi:5-oxoprolinase (ATP-hydrolysing) subunit A